MLGTRPRVRRPTNHGAATRACIMHDPGRGTNCIYATRTFGSSVKYPAVGADHPVPPECHDDQQRLEDAELSRPPWKD